VITGLIKANIPTRSRSSVGEGRLAHHPRPEWRRALLGHGDNAVPAAGTSLPVRVHGAFVSIRKAPRGGKLKVLSRPCTSTRSSTARRRRSGLPGERRDGEEGGDPEQDPLYDEP